MVKKLPDKKGSSTSPLGLCGRSEDIFFFFCLLINKFINLLLWALILYLIGFNASIAPLILVVFWWVIGELPPRVFLKKILIQDYVY